jgi:UDP-GlcNAc:undecaprenyl-phosphate GlcNAc-1-phosphate transferase
LNGSPVIITVLVLLLCLLATYLLCEFALPIGKKFGLIDDPRGKGHGLHEQPTPLMGGIAVMVPWASAALALHWLGYEQVDRSIPIFGERGLLFLSFFLMLGTLDDRFSLSVRGRLISKSLTYLMFVLATHSLHIDRILIPSLGLSLNIPVIDIGLTVLCLVALNNAVNMTDGRNGLLLGMTFIWLVLLIQQVPLLAAHPAMLILPALVAIACFYNLRGKLFSGDAGSYAFSTLAGALAIWAHNLPLAQGGLTTTQLATFFAIPGFDLIRIMASRYRRGVSVTAPDHDHLHHRLDRTWGWRIGLPVYLASVGIPLVVSLQNHKSGLAGFALACVIYLGMWQLTKQTAQGSDLHKTKNVSQAPAE